MRHYTQLAFAFGAVLLLTTPASSAEQTLKMYYFAAGDRGVGGEVTDKFIERVNDSGKGLIRIQTPMLDPASIPARQIGNALKDGIVDIAIAPPGYFSGLAPGLEGLTANSVTPAQQRKNGVYDLVNAETEKRANVRFLAQLGYGTTFNIFTTVPVKTLGDFKNMRLRSGRTYKAFFESIGAQPVLTSRSETFTALERGVVSGYGNVVSEIKIAGWGDVTKFKVEPGFYHALLGLFINAKTWNSLDAKQQAVLNEAALWLETQGNERMMRGTQDASRDLEKSGVKTVNLPPAEAKTFVELANKAIWDDVVKQAPEFGSKLKKLLLP